MWCLDRVGGQREKDGEVHRQEDGLAGGVSEAKESCQDIVSTAENEELATGIKD